jgi:hypothetical protein
MHLVQWAHIVLVAVVHLIFSPTALGRGTGTLSQLIPLTAVDVNGLFFDTLGKVIVTQRWNNSLHNNVTIVGSYKFSLDLNAVVCGLKMRIGDQTWVGQVKEKGAAQVEYTAAVTSGIKSSLLEQLSDSEYQINVGPIPPGDDVEIVIHYLCQAAVRNDGSYQFVLPTNIAEKYVGAATNERDREYATRMSSTPYAGHPGYTFNVDIKWTTGGLIKEVASSTNVIHSEMLSSKSARIRCSVAPENGDFTLQVRTEGSIGAYSYTNDLDGSTILYLHNQIPPEEAVRTLKRMITIVLDRSGSMEGGKMKFAIAAVDQFLSLLPTDGSVFLNVVSFGTTYQPMYSSAMLMTAERIAGMRRLVTNNFRADFGGTELLQCLQDVVNRRYRSAAVYSEAPALTADELGLMDHVIVLLTDGQVSNLHSIVEFLNGRGNENQAARIMSIGIGHDVDRKLVQKLADVTHGICKVLIDEKDVTEALTDVLRYIDKQYYTGLRVLGDYDVVQTSKVLYPTHPVDIFLRLDYHQYRSVILNGLAIEAMDPIHGSKKVWNIYIDQITNSVKPLQQLYANGKIQELRAQMNEVSYMSGAYDALAAEIVNLSVNNAIMNTLTSFIIVSDVQTSSDHTVAVEVLQSDGVHTESVTLGSRQMNGSPVGQPSAAPSSQPTRVPSSQPTRAPSALSVTGQRRTPTGMPSAVPMSSPSAVPTAGPTTTPTVSPTAVPSASPTAVPTVEPTAAEPAALPAASLTATPTASPTTVPTASPTAGPTAEPTAAEPAASSTAIPTAAPTAGPTTKSTDIPLSGDEEIIDTAAGTNLLPLLHCTVAYLNGSCTAYFGYQNLESSILTVPIGLQTGNYFAPGPVDLGQSTEFLPGTTYHQFTITYDCNFPVSWTLNGFTATAGNMTTCMEGCCSGNSCSTQMVGSCSEASSLGIGSACPESGLCPLVSGFHEL